jgi:hypothetical protein
MTPNETRFHFKEIALTRLSSRFSQVQPMPTSTVFEEGFMAKFLAMVVMLLASTSLIAMQVGGCTSQQGAVASARSRLKTDQNSVRKLKARLTADELQQWAEAADLERRRILTDSDRRVAETLAPEHFPGPRQLSESPPGFRYAVLQKVPDTLSLCNPRRPFSGVAFRPLRYLAQPNPVLNRGSLDGNRKLGHWAGRCG